MTDALAAIRAEKAFVKLSPADRDRVLAALVETRSHIETERRMTATATALCASAIVMR